MRACDFQICTAPPPAVNNDHSLNDWIFSGIVKIKDWTQLSLRKRLQKSLSHDWIHEKTSHKFPLRQYYVQLEWKRKKRTAMRTKIVTLSSLYDLIREIEIGEDEATNHAGSVIIEGKVDQYCASILVTA